MRPRQRHCSGGGGGGAASQSAQGGNITIKKIALGIAALALTLNGCGRLPNAVLVGRKTDHRLQNAMAGEANRRRGPRPGANPQPPMSRQRALAIMARPGEHPNGVCTGCQPQLQQLQRSIDQWCRENAALKERIEQMEWER
jgi:hypothetical protein